MTLEIIEILGLGTSNINHIRAEETTIIDLENKGEQKWNALLAYIDEYCEYNDMNIKEIETGKIWLVDD